MGREIKRVPLDFDWPLEKIWQGFLNPHYEGHCSDCAACKGTGFSFFYRSLQSQWYGDGPFDPRSNGSEPFNETTPAVRRFAEQNVLGSQNQFYGQGESAIVREALRLAELFNGQWCHHLTQKDVAVLHKAGRLKEFGDICPSAAQVNTWSIGGFGHDACNCWLVIKARCKRARVSSLCKDCKGKASLWDSPKNKWKAEHWKSTEPPTGDGWQVWETVSEGSPVTPVFATSDMLIDYLALFGTIWDQRPGRSGGWGFDNARAFVQRGWVMSAMGVNGKLFGSNQIAEFEAAIKDKGC